MSLNKPQGIKIDVGERPYVLHDCAGSNQYNNVENFGNPHWLDTSEIDEAKEAASKLVERIRIKKCSDSMMWYAPLIGFEFDVLADEGSVYRTREPAGYINFVLKQDAEVI